MTGRGIPPNFQNFCKIQSLGCKESHSEWFGVKGFIVEKLKDSDFFTVVVIGTRGPTFYANVVILFADFVSR